MIHNLDPGKVPKIPNKWEADYKFISSIYYKTYLSSANKVKYIEISTKARSEIGNKKSFDSHNVIFNTF